MKKPILISTATSVVRMTGISVLIGLAVACSPLRKSGAGGGSVRTKIPLPIAKGQAFGFSVVPLPTMTDLDRGNGAAVRFLIEPFLDGASVKGQDYHLHYVLSAAGVVIATDRLSLEMLTLYYHFEQLRNRAMQNRILNPLDPPLQVGLMTRLKDAEENNANYAGLYNILFIVPYTEGEAPLSVNAGVLAHEYFHSLFQRAVLSKLKSDECNIVCQGINEGLADVWGWIYSKDPNFIAPSMSNLADSRALDVERLPNINTERKYLTGTRLARILFHTAKMMAPKGPEKWAEEHIAEALSTLPQVMRSYKENESFNLGFVLKAIFEAIPQNLADGIMDPALCDYWKNLPELAEIPTFHTKCKETPE